MWMKISENMVLTKTIIADFWRKIVTERHLSVLLIKIIKGEKEGISEWKINYNIKRDFPGNNRK